MPRGKTLPVPVTSLPQGPLTPLPSQFPVLGLCLGSLQPPRRWNCTENNARVFLSAGRTRSWGPRWHRQPQGSSPNPSSELPWGLQAHVPHSKRWEGRKNTPKMAVSSKGTLRGSVCCSLPVLPPLLTRGRAWSHPQRPQRRIPRSHLCLSPSWASPASPQPPPAPLSPPQVTRCWQGLGGVTQPRSPSTSQLRFPIPPQGLPLLPERPPRPPEHPKSMG